jgi:hypothetical protein
MVRKGDILFEGRLMSDPDTSPQALSNVHSSLYSVIENSKKHQWTITNYVILVYAAIFGLSQALKPLEIMERWAFGLLVAAAGGYTIFLLLEIQSDLDRYREQLENLYADKISKEDRKRYLIVPRSSPVYVGIAFLIALIGVVVIGGGLVLYSLLRSNLLKLG